MSRKIISVGNKQYVLSIKEFGDEEDVDIDDFLKIDYSNIIGEIITFPIILNRLGILLADTEARVAEKKMSLEIMEAKLSEKYRNELFEDNKKKPTVDEVKNAVILDKIYQGFRKSYIEAIKNKDYVNSIYWGAKDKSGKLDKLSTSISGDVSDYLIEGKVNSIKISRKGNLIN